MMARDKTHIELLAQGFATRAHTSTAHMYGKYPYYYHLNMVVDEAAYFINLIPEEDQGIFMAACWLHDVIEDCRVTYNDLKEAFGVQVADIVYALTNDKGKNRAERAGDKYYTGIRNIKYAPLAKLCDRIANVRFSIEDGNNDMLVKYAKENKHFISQVYDAEYKLASDRLKDIFRLYGRID